MTSPRGPFGRSFGRRLSAIQPYTPAESVPTDQHLETLRQAPTNLQAILVEHRTALQDLRRQAQEDPNLTEEGRRAYIAGRSEPIHQRTGQAVAALDDQTGTAYGALQQRSISSLPDPTPGVEGMLARQAAWSRVQTLLGTGMTPQQVIDETDDPETLHALEDELPTVLRSRGASLDDAKAIIDTVHDRLAEITGESATNARLAAREADVHMAGLEHLLRHAKSEAAGGDSSGGMSAAIAAQLARDRMASGVPLEDDERPAPSSNRSLEGAIRTAYTSPTMLRHAINDQMRRAAKRPHAPTDQANGDARGQHPQY
ncbi:hypothetical protein [Amycolatopsis sp. NPDC003861]